MGGVPPKLTHEGSDNDPGQHARHPDRLDTPAFCGRTLRSSLLFLTMAVAHARGASSRETVSIESVPSTSGRYQPTDALHALSVRRRADPGRFSALGSRVVLHSGNGVAPGV